MPDIGWVARPNNEGGYWIISAYVGQNNSAGLAPGTAVTLYLNGGEPKTVYVRGSGSASSAVWQYYGSGICAISGDGLETVYTTSLADLSGGSSGGGGEDPPAKTSSCYIYTNGQWKRATPYIYTDGQWKKATAYIRNGSSWKEVTS